MAGRNSSQTESFVEYLRQQRYAKGTVEQYRKAIDRYFSFCTDNHLGVDRPLDDRLRAYLNQERTRDEHPRAYTMLRAAVRQYFLFVTGQKLQVDPKLSLDQWVHDELAGFHTFMASVAALTEATIKSRLNDVPSRAL